jgi:hypothetical protein
MYTFVGNWRNFSQVEGIIKSPSESYVFGKQTHDLPLQVCYFLSPEYVLATVLNCLSECLKEHKFVISVPQGVPFVSDKHTAGVFVCETSHDTPDILWKNLQLKCSYGVL